MRKKGIYKFSSSDYAVQFSLICKVRGSCAAERYAKNLPKQARNDKTYGEVIGCYVHEHSQRAGIWLSPLLHLQRMKELGFALSPCPFNEIMRIQGKPKEVLEGWAEMKKSGVSPDNDSYRIRISSFGLYYDVDGMERMLREMETQPHIVMDWCTYAVRKWQKLGQERKGARLQKYGLYWLRITSYMVKCLSQPNYKKWSSLFLLLVRRFKLQGYLDGSVVPLSDDDDEWCQLDALLQGWILSTITDEVSDLIISSLTTASALWKVIHDLFHDNKHARAMQLEHEFRTTVKGSTSMAAYCQRLQNLADWLDDVDAPVSQHQLVLQMLRGLPADLQGQTSFMQFQDPMPNFLQVRSALMLLDRQRSNPADPGSTALLTTRIGGTNGSSSYGGQHGGSSYDMGDLHFFLGINVHRTSTGMFLHQTQFTHDILERAGMVSCRPISTPVDTKAKLSSSAGTALPDPTLYRFPKYGSPTID
ncbi:unnamed protein product [Cuscuta campestris]|uniref:Reverse transcriptase Ty1/copia-type domain-containing protein n=1 Tax=Cuscuta campestris TaxID=132261 RepID=A0A484M4P5_9ASTE|nr:unnamed protein product [Cuscuta campestris]